MIAVETALTFSAILIFNARKIYKGIAALHPATEKRAKPLQLMQLEKLAASLDTQIAEATQTGDNRNRLGHIRNRALILPGFWQDFRLRRTEPPAVRAHHSRGRRGMTLFLPRTSGSRAAATVLLRALPVPQPQITDDIALWRAPRAARAHSAFTSDARIVASANWHIKILERHVPFSAARPRRKACRLSTTNGSCPRNNTDTPSFRPSRPNSAASMLPGS
ncbi:hypothetical protein [Burkholderia mayonis]|uniref:hypothetical protein n=1 Tax=Burkholderia mayonis TaxID=1385591 RepID=UPI000A96F9AD|nr:hypothetical protein [Burkholderia mayonis]